MKRWLTRWLWLPGIALTLTGVALVMIELQGYPLRDWVRVTTVVGNGLLLIWNGLTGIEMRRLRQENERRQAELKRRWAE